MFENMNKKQATGNATLMTMAVLCITGGIGLIQTNFNAGALLVIVGAGMFALRETLKAKY